MASIVKVNNIQDTSGNVIAAKCGTTVTLGGSGDTIALASGASQTGFGASGAVTWVTTPKTATFTAVTTNGYFVNTTSGVVTANLSAGSAGDIVAFSDYANTWNSNALTLSPNGSDPINGVNEDVSLSTGGLSVTLVYVDGTRGWKNIDDATTNVTGVPNYVTGTGGTPCGGATSGDYKIHTFTATGPFNVTSAGNPCGSTKIDYMVVAGGAGGSSGSPADGGQGAGGAGGFRESVPSPAAWTASPLASPGGALTASVTDYTITVGGGGATSPFGPAERQGCKGGDSVFSTITSAGGGSGSSPGSSGKPAPFMANMDGGSGGGLGFGGYGSPTGTLFGAGNEPPTSPPQGNDGGGGVYPIPAGGPSYGGGGGGGATVAGVTATPTSAGNGGNGATTCISASPTVYAGGGGAGLAGGAGTVGTGGTGGGGSGADHPTAATSGTANTGGGGGGGGTPAIAGGVGGSGVVIVRYKFQN